MGERNSLASVLVVFIWCNLHQILKTLRRTFSYSDALLCFTWSRIIFSMDFTSYSQEWFHPGDPILNFPLRVSYHAMNAWTSSGCLSFFLFKYSRMLTESSRTNRIKAVVLQRVTCSHITCNLTFYKNKTTTKITQLFLNIVSTFEQLISLNLINQINLNSLNI